MNKKIKNAALRSASFVAMAQAEDFFRDVYRGDCTNRQVHRKAVELMKEEGLPAFLMNYHENSKLASFGSLLPITHGTRFYGEDGGRVHYLIFPLPEVKAYAKEFGHDWFDKGEPDEEQLEDMCVTLSDCQKSNGGPGQYFAHEPMCYIQNGFVKIKQSAGLDV